MVCFFFRYPAPGPPMNVVTRVVQAGANSVLLVMWEEPLMPNGIITSKINKSPIPKMWLVSIDILYQTYCCIIILKKFTSGKCSLFLFLSVYLITVTSGGSTGRYEVESNVTQASVPLPVTAQYSVSVQAVNGAGNSLAQQAVLAATTQGKRMKKG